MLLGIFLGLKKKIVFNVFLVKNNFFLTKKIFLVKINKYIFLEMAGIPAVRSNGVNHIDICLPMQVTDTLQKSMSRQANDAFLADKDDGDKDPLTLAWKSLQVDVSIYLSIQTYPQ